MDGHRDRRASDREPGGLLPRRTAGSPGGLRRFVTWILHGREEIDQEGLLAERTLRVGQRRPERDDED